MKQCGKCWLTEEPKDERARALGLIYCESSGEMVDPRQRACGKFLHRDDAISRLRRAL